MAYEWVTQKLLSKVSNQTAIYDNSRKYGFGWWFAYFWKELGVKNRNEELLKEVVASVFGDKFPKDIATQNYGNKRKAGDAVADGFTALLPEPKDLASNSAHYRQMLTKLLNIGFREMPTTELGTGPVPRGAAIFAELIDANKIGNRVPVAIAYRGEGREFKTVIEHKGAQSRADLGLLNMNQPWHPFSNPAVASKTYARGASGDNCLYTVTSIATDIKIPVGFPLIEDEDIYGVPALPATEPVKDLSKWNYKMFSAARAKGPVRLAKAAISGVNKPSGIFLATDSFIYAVKVKRAIHTQDFVETTFAMPQNQCKERGVRGIKLKNFLAGARLRRIHLGPARMCGVVAFVQEVRYFINGQWMQHADPQQFADYHFYGDTAAALSALRLINGQFNVAGGNGRLEGEVDAAMAASPLPNVTRIEQWNLTFDQFNAWRDSKPGSLYFGLTK